MAKPTPIPLWGTATDGIEKKYTRLGVSLLAHEKVRMLPPNAFRVYVYMTLYCKGYQDFVMPYSLYRGFTTKPAFSRAIKELAKAGLIEVIEKNGNLRKPNKYRFSTQYREGG
jgi:hypothetical protein